jgi:hypothetical protein
LRFLSRHSAGASNSAPSSARGWLALVGTLLSVAGVVVYFRREARPGARVGTAVGVCATALLAAGYWGS